eukprot:6472236-Prymnesium_polylepis.1
MASRAPRMMTRAPRIATRALIWLRPCLQETELDGLRAQLKNAKRCQLLPLPLPNCRSLAPQSCAALAPHAPQLQKPGTPQLRSPATPCTPTAEAWHPTTAQPCHSCAALPRANCSLSTHELQPLHTRTAAVALADSIFDL